MSATLEREVKLPFETADAARAAVLAIGATPLHGRRLQEDCLLDSANDDLRRRRSALRVRQDGGRCLLTFKGPVQPASIKVREELALGDCTIAIDETPVGVFVEIEGGECSIDAAAQLLGRGPGDYVLESYRGLFVHHCEQLGIEPTDMLFNLDGGD